MTCQQAEKHIFAARDGSLDQADRTALMAHVSACPTCRQTQSNLTSAVQSWNAEVQAVRVPDAQLEWQKLRRQMHAGSAATPRRSLLGWLALPAAAAAAIAIGLYVAPSRPGETTPAPSPSIAAAPSGPADAQSEASTVVYVDDKSGWTFVWTTESAGGQHI